jgi:hypothetical protein
MFFLYIEWSFGCVLGLQFFKNVLAVFDIGENEIHLVARRD